MEGYHFAHRKKLHFCRSQPQLAGQRGEDSAAYPGGRQVEARGWDLQSGRLHLRQGAERLHLSGRQRFSPRRASWSMMGSPSLELRQATAAAASSRRSAVQRGLCAESRETFRRRLVTWRGRWPRPKHSNHRAVIANVLRCCLHISSVSFGSVVCACVGHAVPSSSSHWRQSRKIFADWQSSSSDHRRSQRRALHKECRVRRQ